jgi:hypothetical protein
VQTKVAGQWATAGLYWGAQLAIDQLVPTTAGGGRLDAVTVRAGDAVWNLGPPGTWVAPSILAGP